MIMEVRNQNFEINEAKEKELKAISLVHKKAYGKSHFTSLFSSNLLSDYYRYFLTGESKILIYVESDEILGFIVFGKSISKKIKHFKKNNKLLIFFTALKNPLSSFKILLKKVIKFKISKNKFRESSFILLSVASMASNKKVGYKLMKAMINEAIYNKETNIGLYVNMNNFRALNLYKKLNFKIQNQISNQFYMELNIN